MELSSENRIQSNIVNIRCCSFCRRPGHMVNNCNSIQLVNFERSCFREIEISIRYHDRPKERYLDWLFEYSLHNNDLIKAYATSKIGLNIRNRRIGDIVKDIHIYHCRIYSIPDTRISNFIVNNNEDNNLYDIDSLILLNSIGSIKINTLLLQHNIDIKLMEETETYIDIIKDCCICYEEYNNKQFVKLDCKHEFCKNCIKTQLNLSRSDGITCGLCRHNVKVLHVQTEEILNELKKI
jgi:hypothetical protein